MEVINIECPKCGATMSVNRKNRKAECPYCKTVLPILDSATTSSQLESQERIRLKELELEHERREHNSHRVLIVLLLCITSVIGIAALVLSMRSSEVKRTTPVVIQTYMAEDDNIEALTGNDGAEEDQIVPIVEKVYGVEEFEDALNRGEDMEGTFVTFVVQEIRPQSAYGYNLWAGEHLNFVSSKNPNVKVGDTLTVKTTSIDSAVGSWIIHYEKAGSELQ